MDGLGDRTEAEDADPDASGRAWTPAGASSARSIGGDQARRRVSDRDRSRGWTCDAAARGRACRSELTKGRPCPAPRRRRGRRKSRPRVAAGHRRRVRRRLVAARRRLPGLPAALRRLERRRRRRPAGAHRASSTTSTTAPSDRSGSTRSGCRRSTRRPASTSATTWPTTTRSTRVFGTLDDFDRLVAEATGAGSG